MPSERSRSAQNSKVTIVKSWHHSIKDNSKLLKAVNTVFAHEAHKLEKLIFEYRDELMGSLNKFDQLQCDNEFIAEAAKALGLISRKLNIIRDFSHLNPGPLLDSVIKFKEQVIHHISSLKAMQIGIQRINQLIKNINGTNKTIVLSELDRQLQFFKSCAKIDEDDNQQPHQLLFNRIYLILTEFRSCVNQVEVPCNSIEFVVSGEKYTLDISLINVVMEQPTAITSQEVFPDMKRKNSEISANQSNSKEEVKTEEPEKELINVWHDFNKIGAAIEAKKSEQILPEQLYDHLTKLTEYLLELDKTYATIVKVAIDRLSVSFNDDEKLLINLEDLLNSFKADDIDNVKIVCQKLDDHLELVLNVINEEKEEQKENNSVDEILCEEEAYNSVAELIYSVGDLADRLTDLAKLASTAQTFIKNLQGHDLTAAQEELVKLTTVIKPSASETITSLFCSSLVTLCEKSLENHMQNRSVLSF